MALGSLSRHGIADCGVSGNGLTPSSRFRFYRRLNEILDEAGFDPYVENLCRPFYASGRGRPSIPPGVYFRMLLIRSYDHVSSQRELAARCRSDVLLRSFLRVSAHSNTPNHSSLTVIRKRIPAEIHERALGFALSLTEMCGLVREDDDRPQLRTASA